MKKTLVLLGAVLVTSFLATGCAGPERKLGRGFSNTFEIVRFGEMRRTVEQASLFEPDSRYASSWVRGFNRTLGRTGVGIYEIVTFPIPNGKENNHADYGPIWKPEFPVYPDSYKPHLVEDLTFATDTAIGFSGGDIAPWFPGSRFRIFEN